MLHIFLVASVVFSAEEEFLVGGPLFTEAMVGQEYGGPPPPPPGSATWEAMVGAGPPPLKPGAGAPPLKPGAGAPPLKPGAGAPPPKPAAETSTTAAAASAAPASGAGPDAPPAPPKVVPVKGAATPYALSGEYALALKYNDECAQDGLSTIFDEATCKAACEAMGDTGFDGVGSWTHSPNCFKVVGESVWKGRCHWNDGARNPRLTEQLNRQVCVVGTVGSTTTPPPVVSANGEYQLTQKFNDECKADGLLTITDETTCRAACNDLGDTGFDGVGSWTHSPNCFKVVGESRWKGRCHWNNGARNPRLIEKLNRQVCVKPGSEPPAPPSSSGPAKPSSSAPATAGGAPPKPTGESEVSTSKLRRVNKALKTALEALTN